MLIGLVALILECMFSKWMTLLVILLQVGRIPRVGETFSVHVLQVVGAWPGNRYDLVRSFLISVEFSLRQVHHSGHCFSDDQVAHNKFLSFDPSILVPFYLPLIAAISHACFFSLLL